MDKTKNKKEEKEDEEDDEEDEKEAFKFQTIVARQAVQVLRISEKDINEVVSKMNYRELTNEEIDKMQNATVSAFYASMLFSDEKKKEQKEKEQKTQ